MTTSTKAPLDYDLNDRFRPGSGPILLTGVQAIARFLVEQHAHDCVQGLNVGTFVSGYQGSPLGGVDRMLTGMKSVLDANKIRFVPGLNEELAATAVWGSQATLDPESALHDGVIGVWYGKGPGVDRATDAIRHANIYGANPKGGMVLIVGDDPASKSSTVPAVSERSLAALGVPVFFPRNAREIVTMGMHAVALSRASGCIVALKVVADVADGAWKFSSDDLSDLQITVPTIDHEGRPFAYKQRPMAVAPASILAAEADLVGPRWKLVEAYAHANALDAVEIDPPAATLGIVAAGTAYDAARQALLDLGVSDESLSAAGIKLVRLGMVYPLAADKIRKFATGLDHLLVVEDKTSFVEAQIREILYGVDGAPLITGKKDGAGADLIPAAGELSAGRLLGPFRRTLGEMVEMKQTLPPPIQLEVLPTTRSAYFCSGCPHNRSTALPDGSLGGGGIGCHILVTMSGRQDSAVTGLTQMGGEGSQWIGQAPFTSVPHVFQNIGDGTFFHSGQLALQACVAAGVNITYKLLYNDVVAMTGAQDAEGALSVAELTHKLKTEGVKQIIVCADEPDRHSKRALAQGTKLWHRDRLDEAQRELRDAEGVTVLIYDQHCAADARRRRKRGSLPARSMRVVINEEVCEGCGDCGVKSNCLSVQPVDTELGRKTRIDQTSCNTDYSCLDGDCPSFITIESAPNAKAAPHGNPAPPACDDPDSSRHDASKTWNILLAGIGGTGILTVNQVLATAALRSGFEVESLDQVGLSQKAGPVVSHLRFSAGPIEPANRLTPGTADCILAFDLLTAAENRNLLYGDKNSTTAIVSSSKTPTGDMVYDKNIAYPETDVLLGRLEKYVRSTHYFDALSASLEIFGDTTFANFLLVGAALQAGALPLPAAAVEEAIAINGVAVEENIDAFRWGRVSVDDPERFASVTVRRLTPVAPELPPELLQGTRLSGELRRIVERNASRIIDFQSVAAAREYVGFMEQVRDAESAVTEATEFSESVARGLYKFTAYKDEYEVARLLTAQAFVDGVRAQFPQGSNMTYNLHPPALRAVGWKKKIGLGPRRHFALRILAKGKVLRGTRLDPFGYAHVRRVERELLDEYKRMTAALSTDLNEVGYGTAVRIAGLPDIVRGYEGIKLENAQNYAAELKELGLGNYVPKSL